SIPFAILAVMLAAACAAATEILSKRDDRPGLQASIALFATGTLAALALALTFALEKGWLTIALALMSAGTAWISTQRPIAFLRTLAAILAGIVVLRIGYEPRIVGQAVGTTPIFNWLLWGYGIPAASFRTGSVIHNAGAILLTAFAGLTAVFGLLMLENPILWYIDVGGAVINLLLLGYALPAVLALLLSYAVAGRRPVRYANTIAAGAL